MPDQQDAELLKRMQELAERAVRRRCDVYSEFLTEAEQGLCRPQLFATEAEPCLFGGYAQAERKRLRFGSAELCGYDEDWPVACLQIRAKGMKFQQPLQHRDVLGAVMNKGIRRSVVGDILFGAEHAYLFCIEELADYLCGELTQIRHATVEVSRTLAVPEDVLPVLREQEVVVASLRLDALLAAVYRLSRSESQTLIRAGKVFVNDRPVLHADSLPKEGERVSVRGYGRFVFAGIRMETRKGRLRAVVLL